MGKWLQKIDRIKQDHLFWWLVATSILLAAWMQHIQHRWINPDSVLYLEQARLFAQGNWREAYAVFNWPLYGSCIAAVHVLTGVDIHFAAQLLNLLFFGLATAAFLKIIQLAGGTSRTSIAAAILLFSSQYIVGDVLEMLMRDEGFWAGYLFGILFFIRYALLRKLHDGIAWQICMMISTLFRIEGILYLLLLPLAFFFLEKNTGAERLKYLLLNYSLAISIAVVIGLILAIHPDISIQQFGRLREIFTINLYNEFTQTFSARANIMSSEVLGKFLSQFAVPGLLLTFVYVMLSKTLTATGIIGTVLAGLGIYHRKRMMNITVRRILITVIGIAVFSMMLIIIKVFVLSSRYVVPLAWVLLIFGAFYIDEISRDASTRRRAILLFLLVALGGGFVKNLLPKSEGYNHMRAAIAWLKVHNKTNAPVFYDENRLRYFANAPYLGTWSAPQDYVKSSVADNSIRQHHYLVISYDIDHLEVTRLIQSTLPEYCEIKRFDGVRAKKATVIYSKDCSHATAH